MTDSTQTEQYIISPEAIPPSPHERGKIEFNKQNKKTTTGNILLSTLAVASRLVLNGALIVAAQNTEAISTAAGIIREGKDIPDTEYCEPYRPAEIENTTSTTAHTHTRTTEPWNNLSPVEKPNFAAPPESRSSFLDNSWTDINLISSYNQYQNMFNNLILSHTSPNTGITYEFYRLDVGQEKSTYNIAINTEALDQIEILPFDNNTQYDLPRVKHVIECMRQSLIQDKRYADTIVPIVIPDQPACTGDARVIIPSDNCKQAGLTTPPVDIHIGPIDITPKNFFILLTTGRKYDKDNITISSRLALHEIGGHALPIMTEGDNYKFFLNDEENFANYIEEQVQESNQDRLDSIPPLVTYSKLD